MQKTQVLEELRELSVVGKSVPRIEGREKVMGLAEYTGDVKLPEMLYGICEDN